MKKLTLMSVIPLVCILVNAQPPALKPLSVGDTVPEVVMPYMYNYPSTSLKISDLKGKLVILDFWAIWCHGCLQDIAKLDSLQKEFQNQIQIVLVNDVGERDTLANKQKTIAFIDKLKSESANSFSLPSSLKRIESLEKLFPHVFIPHYVWLSGDGKVIGFTNSEQVNRINITKILKGQPNPIILKSVKKSPLTQK